MEPMRHGPSKVDDDDWPEPHLILEMAVIGYEQLKKTSFFFLLLLLVVFLVSLVGIGFVWIAPTNNL